MNLKEYLNVKKIWQNKSLKNVMVLTSGTVLSQVLPIVFFPILSRLYSPYEYGILGIFMSISMLLVVFSSLQLNLAILIPKEDIDAVNILKTGLFLCIVASAFCLLLIVFFANSICSFLNIPDLKPWLYLLPITIFFSGGSVQLTGYLNRIGRFKEIAFSRILVSVFTVFFSLLFGFKHIGAGGLVISYAIGSLVGFAILCHKYLSAGDLKLITLVQVKTVIGQHKNFPIYTLPTELLSTLSQQLPSYFFSIYSGAQSVGLFSRGRQLLGLPASYLTGAISEVYRQKASQYFQHDRQALKKLFIKTTLHLIVVSIVPFSLLLAYSPDIYAFMFGEQWREAGVYSQCLVIMYFVKFVVTPPSYVFYFYGKQKLDFVIQVLIILATSVSLVIGLLVFSNVILALILFSCSYSLLFSFYGIYSFKLISDQNNFKRQLR
jgi:O-antigen/teichoic acid export membrane protein